MASKKEKSMHKPARMQKSFGLLRLLLVAAAIALLTLSGTQAPAQEREIRFSVLYNFTGGAGGNFPIGSLIRDEAGNLYGTAGGGGPFGYGTVFKLDPSGKETVLYTFCSQTNCADGYDPSGGLIRDEDGNLYGTTFSGGSPGLSGGASGTGVVFKLDPSGNETILHNFADGADGAFPGGSLIRDEDGNLYGTTREGGSAPNGGAGVVFKLDPSGKYTVLYSFTGGADGGGPIGGVIRDRDGNLYGATSEGGNTGNCRQLLTGGCGVIFKLDPSGRETVLYAFTAGADGGFPNGPLVRDEAGNLYGTTQLGGNPSSSACNEIFFGAGEGGCGVVFKVNRRGEETVLYTFTGGTDGAIPEGGLTLGDDGRWDGDLYGTTADGGNEIACPFPTNEPPTGFGCGVVFKLDRRGKYTVLHTFNGTDGYGPGGVLLRHHGSLYGTASGGATPWGNIFKITLEDECDHERHHDWDHERDHECGHERDHDWDH